jgi:hypothetical protein
MENNKDKGVVFTPYIIGEPKSTDINGEVVWYRNKLLNLLLKIKRFFYKSKNLKNVEKYSNKKVNSSFYGVVKITGDENKESH